MTKKNSLANIIKKISKEAHGCSSLKELKPFLVAAHKKTARAITDFLDVEFLQDPIKWEDVKDNVWKTEEDKLANKFSFLQGDIILTSKVLRLGISQYNKDHNLWLVRSPSCDCVRADYIRVSPIIEVKNKQTIRKF